ncbi:hypothetical protein [Acaryochloris marina]|uniref:Uncharacterized protein n=1 Tax=Acaryochloris marina (strain MBIC 11017) TaxID=329726 RepID=B0CDG1_ACAM1|nr:hypothetical protein [Acaryochloris marina]ABW26886.1 conserved hypothetical protein [Acaryochloris marina MBIC11017]
MSSSSEQPPKSTRHTKKKSVDMDPQTVSDEQSNSPKGETQQTHVDNMQLKGPPRRPVAKTPPPPAPEIVAVEKKEPAADVTIDVPESAGQQPIPPPSEPMQYRAIGLIKGKYRPSEEQFNRGDLITEDETHLDAVLLGQVMSLVKKYLDLEQTYLWVVYPRTREKEETLHMQIVGVWSTEGFGPMAATEASDTPEEPSQLAAPLQDGYFSIRGEIVFQSTERNYLLVKIQQSPRKSSDRPKAFKLKLTGNLKDKTLGYFWDLHVQRQGGELAIVNGQKVALVPPKRKSKQERSESRKPRKFSSPRPQNTSNKPRPVSKPIIKRRSSPES